MIGSDMTPWIGARQKLREAASGISPVHAFTYTAAFVFLLALGWRIALPWTDRGDRVVADAAVDLLGKTPHDGFALLLLTPADCSSYTFSVDGFEAVVRDKRIPAATVILGPPRSEEARNRVRARLGPVLPIRWDERGRGQELLDAVGGHSTPVVIFFDGQARLVAVVPPAPNPYRQAQLLDRAASYVELWANAE